MTRAPYATTWDFRWGQMPNRRPGMGGTVGAIPRYELHASCQRTRIDVVAQKNLWQALGLGAMPNQNLAAELGQMGTRIWCDGKRY